MKMEQNTSQTSTALLRTADGVETIETNSLCCAAAGIIAPLSATAEVLIPLEKLREAATPNATLIARDRPLAQPVMGYEHIQDSNRGQCFRNLCACSSRHPSEGYDRTVFGKLHEISITIIKCWIREKTLGMFSKVAHRMAQLQPSQCHLGNRHLDEAHFPRKRLTFLKRRNKLENNAMFWVFLIYVVIGVNRNLSCVFRHPINFLKKLVVLAPRSIESLLALFVGDPNRNQNRNNRSNGLNPSSSIFFCIKIIKQYEECPAQRTNRQKKPQHPSGVDGHICWKSHPSHNYRHPAIERTMSLPTFHAFVHGGQV